MQQAPPPLLRRGASTPVPISPLSLPPTSYPDIPRNYGTIIQSWAPQPLLVELTALPPDAMQLCELYQNSSNRPLRATSTQPTQPKPANQARWWRARDLHGVLSPFPHLHLPVDQVAASGFPMGQACVGDALLVVLPFVSCRIVSTVSYLPPNREKGGRGGTGESAPSARGKG